MKEKLEYVGNMVVDYCGLKYDAAMYQVKKTVEFITKYKEGCAIVAGVTIVASIAKALIEESND